MLEEKEFCKNCGAELYGKFCHECGQKNLTSKDKGLLSFFSELISSIFVADGKFFLTMKLMITKPGELSLSFIKGIRKRYLSPLQMFFFANLIYFLFPIISSFNTSLYTQLNGLPYSDWVRPKVEQRVENSSLSMEEFTSVYERHSNSNAKLLLILLVFMQGLVLRVLFWKRKDLFMVDLFAESAYFYSFYILAFLVVLPGVFLFLINQFDVPLGWLFSEVSLSISLFFIIWLYSFFQIKRAFAISWLEAGLKSLALGLWVIPGFILYRFVLFWISYWMSI